MQKACFIFLIFLHSQIGSAQREAFRWYFGEKAGVQFSHDTVIALTDGDLVSLEGACAACQPNGELLFYSQGTQVWNAYHQIVPNGFGLKGHNSTTQTCVFVPVPGNDTLIYLFTLSDWVSGTGLHYTLLNKNMDNGLGGIVDNKKNVFLYQTNSEKLASYFNRHDLKAWVLVHGTNNNIFAAFEINHNGLVEEPVTSQSGAVHPSNSSNIGQMQFSANGDRLACAVYTTDGSQLSQVFLFDKQAGMVSSPQTLEPINGAYGCCFSPDGTKIYFSDWEEQVIQFDIGSLNAPVASPTREVVGVFRGGRFGQIQTGPDGRLYIAKNASQWLAVIEKPNAGGAKCQLKLNGVNLRGRFSRYGLPQFPNYFLLPLKADFEIEEPRCTQNRIRFRYRGNGDYDSLNWILSDGRTSTRYTDTIILSFLDAGNYEMLLKVWRNGIMNYHQKAFSIDELRDSFERYTLCQGDTLLLGNQQITDTGFYQEVIYNPLFPCGLRLNYLVKRGLHSRVSIDTTLCANQTLALAHLTVSTAGHYFDTLTNEWGCDSIVEVRLHFDKGFRSVTYDTACSDEGLELNGKIIRDSGIYQVVLGCDTMLHFVHIIEATNVSFLVKPDSCNLGLGAIHWRYNDTIKRDMIWEHHRYFERIEELKAGDYKLELVTPYCSRSFLIEVPMAAKGCKPLFFLPNVFTPGLKGPTENNLWRIEGELPEKIWLRVYSRWGELLYETRNPGFKWDGKYRERDLPSGVYLVLLSFQYLDGEKMQQEVIKQSLMLLSDH